MLLIYFLKGRNLSKSNGKSEKSQPLCQTKKQDEKRAGSDPPKLPAHYGYLGIV